MVFYQIFIMAWYASLSVLQCKLLYHSISSSFVAQYIALLGPYLWRNMLLYQTLIIACYAIQPGFYYGLLCNPIMFIFVVKYAAPSGLHFWPTMLLYYILICCPIYPSTKCLPMKSRYFPGWSISWLASSHVFATIWATGRGLDS